MRNEFVESYDPTIQGVRTPTLNTWLYPNIFLVRGVQEDSRSRRGVDMGKYHLHSGGQPLASWNSALGSQVSLFQFCH
jgi:hypothetical protein